MTMAGKARQLVLMHRASVIGELGELAQQNSPKRASKLILSLFLLIPLLASPWAFYYFGCSIKVIRAEGNPPKGGGDQSSVVTPDEESNAEDLPLTNLLNRRQLLQSGLSEQPGHESDLESSQVSSQGSGQ